MNRTEIVLKSLAKEKTTNWKNNNNSVTTNRKHLLNAYHVPDAVLTTLHLERIKSP